MAEEPEARDAQEAELADLRDAAAGEEDRRLQQEEAREYWDGTLGDADSSSRIVRRVEASYEDDDGTVL